jgi:hypothetical protein
MAGESGFRSRSRISGGTLVSTTYQQQQQNTNVRDLIFFFYLEIQNTKHNDLKFRYATKHRRRNIAARTSPPKHRDVLGQNIASRNIATINY